MPKNTPNPDGVWAALWSDIAQTCGGAVAAELHERHNMRVRAQQRLKSYPHIPPDAPRRASGKPRKAR